MVVEVLVRSLAEKQIKKLLDRSKDSVYVGYLEGPRHQDSKLTNAEIAYLNTMGVRPLRASKEIKELQGTGSYSLALQAYIRTKGDPKWRIPPRPFVEPGIEYGKAQIIHYLFETVDNFLDGDELKAKDSQERVGMAAVNAIRKFVRDYPANGLAPNAPSTIAEKGEDHPLVGKTGELMRSLTYVIR